MQRGQVFFAAIVFAAAAVSAVAAPVRAAGHAGIADFLARSARDWNRGDLDAFMAAYERSPDTVYVSAKGVVHGYAAIRAHYAGHYGKRMGTLSFSGLSVRMLGDKYAVILAHWHLAMHGGTQLTGPFSLVLHDSPTGWHIIEDCTP